MFYISLSFFSFCLQTTVTLVWKDHAHGITQTLQADDHLYVCACQPSAKDLGVGAHWRQNLLMVKISVCFSAWQDPHNMYSTNTIIEDYRQTASQDWYYYTAFCVELVYFIFSAC